MSSETWEKVALCAFLICMGGCMVVMSAVTSGFVTPLDNLIIGGSFVMLLITGFSSVLAGLARERERIHGE